VNVVQEFQKAKKDQEVTGEELPDKFVNLPYTINLDNPMNEEGDTLLDVLENPNSDKPEEVFSTKEVLKEKLMSILNILDDREKVIIEDYFGLSGSSRTLEDIGNDFDLTKERVRQIKEKALRKLRNESNVLFDYI
jgi:RNA polymerase primary sigma factor